MMHLGKLKRTKISDNIAYRFVQGRDILHVCIGMTTVLL